MKLIDYLFSPEGDARGFCVHTFGDNMISIFSGIGVAVTCIGGITYWQKSQEAKNPRPDSRHIVFCSQADSAQIQTDSLRKCVVPIAKPDF